MKDEKCFTSQTVQNYEKCDFETARKICKILEDIGCLTKAPDSKYYITNAENMGEFISIIKIAQVFSKIKQSKNLEDFKEWFNDNM